DDEAMLRAGSPEYLASHGIDFGGVTARFDGFTRGTPGDLAVYHRDKCSNIAEVAFVTDRKEYVVTGFSIGAGNVEIRYFGGPLAEPLTGKHDMFLKGDTIVAVAAPGQQLPVVRRIFEGASPDDDYVLRFNSFEELIDYCRDRDMSLLDVVVSVESAYQRTTADDIHRQMLAYWKRMERSVTAGIGSSRSSMFGLSGGSASRMDGYLKDNRLFDNIWGRAAAYATAVNEQNARSGVIVACPTAGSCGILPGVLKAYAEMTDAPEDRIVQALLIAGFLGMLLFSDVSTSGAAYGCQAEIGSAAAMAASAVCFLEGGDVEQIIAAFVLAIKNSLGLICDPIAGLVEVPCVKRNGIYSSMAITAAMMALSGVKSFVSPDEVILVMREVGEKLSSDYKETARGGLAQTRDGKYVEKMFEAEVRRFFADSAEYYDPAEHSD
ncbi:MAG TPA: L-serine ammonia-lyase, iron-sulfur-dependent, subunit alpha, partial [Myxococcota bacterium]|nr:L-serine ammonia-lyase, iron-sulfur-dependent, subunit alpha [Myxococcota bacterium]HQP95148.1 L-serine ammonia-lyase, iron-sulfur-dependent, subunit alpha [Myxococcota bacterium]